MRKKNQKEELPGSPGCSATLPGFIVDETHAGQGAAPTPGELRIPGDLFVKGRSKLSDCFATARALFSFHCKIYVKWPPTA